MQGVVRLWEKFSREVPCENKLRVEQYVSAISDDLCYINDLLEHVEELNFDVCHKFVSFGVPWLIENISKELNTGTLNFIPSGYVIFSILEYLKCSYILNILVISLFSSKISEKMSYFTTKGSIPNNQLDVLEEYQGPIDNIIKHQVYAFLNDLKMCPITLLIMNNAISNEHLSKKVLYECQLLPKEDLKQQRLIRQILQDKHDYSSDRVLTEFLIKISTGNYPKFTMFLACRIILICSFFPSDIFLPQFLFEVNREIADVIAKLLIMIKSENLPDILLEAFEEASNNVKQYKWEEKIEFPKEILTKSDLSEQGIYRLPSSTFERYQNFFHKFFLLRKVKNLIFGEKIQNEGGVRKNSELADLTCNDGRVIIECLDNLKLIVQDFEIIVIGENGKEKGFRLRFIEVMVEGKNQTGLNLVINQPKKATNVKVKFFDAEACKVAKEIIESKRKKCKNKEVSHIKSFLGQEASLVESQQ